DEQEEQQVHAGDDREGRQERGDERPGVHGDLGAREGAKIETAAELAGFTGSRKAERLAPGGASRSYRRGRCPVCALSEQALESGAHLSGGRRDLDARLLQRRDL